VVTDEEETAALAAPAGDGTGTGRELLTQLGRAWLHGQKIDWNELYKGKKKHRVPLPTYPFERKRYWPETRGLNLDTGVFDQGFLSPKKRDIADWFYIPSWKRSALPAADVDADEGTACWLVFADDSGLGSQLVKKLGETNRPVITVTMGRGFLKQENRCFMVNPRVEADYDALFAELGGHDPVPNRIVHLWGAAANGDEDIQNAGFYSLLHIAQAVGRQGFTHKIEIAVVTADMQEVTGGDGVCPGKATVMGPVKVIPVEYPNIICRSIDVKLPLPIRQLYAELTAGSPEPVVAFRGNYRWVQVFEPIRLEKPKNHVPGFKPGGVYLVTGGLGGIGFCLAGYLAETVQAKLILTGRKGLPPREEWGRLAAGNDSGGRDERIKKVKAIEALGSEVLVLGADVTQRQRMQEVIDRALARFGRIDGVIHAAGLPDGAMIQRRTREASERVFAAKIKGTLVLDALLKDMALDFFILCSSINSILPIFGQVGYCAANAFLDAFAHYRASQDNEGPTVISINWTRWQGIGIAAIAEEYHRNLTGEDLTGGLSIEEGVETFSRIPGNKLAQVAVSAENLQRLVEQYRVFKVSSLMETFDGTAVPGRVYQRPELKTGYVPPGSDIEKKLAVIWAGFFGFDRVGILDDFFELGGDSLKVITLVSRIHKELNVKISIEEFFRRPLVKELAKYIENRGAGREDRYISIEPSEKKEYYPLSSAQKRLYLLQQMDAGTVVYNIPFFAAVGKDIDKNGLEAALKKLVTRHESLRTSFIMKGDEPVQRIHEPGEIPFEIEYYDGKSPTGFIRPFDLSRTPLIRSGLIKNPDGNYTWMVDMHHIIADGLSQTILVEDFMLLYNGAGLGSMKLQYRDFSQWQNRLSARGEIKEQENYWLGLYASAGWEEIPRLNLPIDHKRPEVFTFAGDSYEFILEREAAIKFRETGAGNGGTLYMCILAALNVLFYKYTGQSDIIIGSVTAGRQHGDIQRIIGMFANTLAMRNYPCGEKTYESFLREVIAHSLKALENQDVQFEELVGRLDLERNPSRNPLFDICMLVQNLPEVVKGEEAAAAGDTGFTFSLYKSPVSRFDMTFVIFERGDEVHIDIEYYTAIFAKESIERLVSHFKHIIEVIGKNPGVMLKDIEIVTPGEKEKILWEFNDTEAGYPGDRTIHELFREQARQTPDHIAVKGAHELHELHEEIIEISYKELNGKSNQLAHMLRQKGVQPDSIVGIMMERSVEMIIGILGILKAGGAYLPIDPDYPQERIDYMLQDSNARVLLKKSEIRMSKFETNPNDQNSNDQNEVIPGIVLNFEHLDFEFVSDFEFRASNLNSSNLAYVIYTSGTTGKPKGTLIQHRNVVRLMINDKFPFDFSCGDVWTLFHSFCFDFSVWEMYGALLYGGRLVIIPKMTARDTGAFLERLESECVTVLNQTPSAFYLLMERELARFDPGGGGNGRKLGLRYVIFGGEALAPGRLKKWKEAYPGTRLINMYGITETTVHVTVKEIEANEIALNKSNMGKAIPTLKTYVLDNDLMLRPIGAFGECCVGGAGVARGYLNRVELTGEKFVRHPYEPGGMLYKSGDLVRLSASGEMEYLGRIDSQVKIRGFRVELGEVESGLLALADIKEAVVLPIEGGLGGKHLCAYIVSPRSLESPELRKALSANLPDYMIPSYFVRVERIPLTPNGKVDRAALPAPQIGAGTGYTAPRTRVEKKLAGIWREVLEVKGRAVIGIDDNFFDLGGHSLKAAVLTSKIHKELGVKVSLVEVFRGQTIRALAEYIRRAEGAGYASIEPVEKKEYYALSSAQKRLYLIRQMDPESTAYNMPIILPVEKEVERSGLEAALKKLIARHESLRTSFIMAGDEPVQRIHDQVKFEIEFFDLAAKALNSAVKSAKEHEEAENIIRYFVRSFDLARAPLIRSGLIETPDGHHIWMIDLHHIVSDGTSQTILIEDFIALYHGKELNSLRLQYKDFAAWQNHLFASGEPAINVQEAYWLNLYGDVGEIPRINLAADYKRPEIFTFAGNHYEFALDRGEVLELKAFASRDGGTLYMCMLAILNTLFYKYTGQTDIIIGSGTAGRSHADLPGIIGMFVNTLAMRCFPDGEKTYGDFLTEVIAHSIGALDNRDVPFEALVERLNLGRDTSRNPLFDVLIVVQNFQQAAAEAVGLTAAGDNRPPAAGTHTAAKFDLTFIIRESGDDVVIDIEYYTGIFKAETIRRLAGHVKNIVKAVAGEPAVKIKDIEITTEEEKETILFQFNETFTDYPRDKTIRELFEEQAARTPDSVAVIGESKALRTAVTYRALNEESNRLANLLRRKGVKPDIIVGILVDRSLEMIIGILGILKSGGAYMPLDPHYPGKRIRYILNDSGAGFVLSQKTLGEGVGGFCETVNLDDEGLYHPHAGENERVNLKAASTPVSLAYTTYTSGSTGKPKGVMIENRPVINFIEGITRLIPFREQDSILSLTTICFDIFGLETLLPLTRGSRVVMGSREEQIDPVEASSVIEREKITIFQVTPSRLQMFTADDRATAGLGRLKCLLVGGEAFPETLLEKVKGFFAGKIYNLYGPTETTIWSTVKDLTGNVPLDIGGPTANTQIYILGSTGGIQPLGVAGELCIGGIGLARGYLNRPELTADRFVPVFYRSYRSYRSYKTYSSRKIYKTGDLARWLADGNIEFLGRIDHQLKIRGFRVELGEIEQRLLTHDSVRETVVLAGTSASGDTYLCAYIAWKEGQTLGGPEIKQYLSQTLPDYMIPAYFVNIDHIPLTPNGKVDRKALPSLSPALKSTPGEEYAAPRNQVEEKLAAIWSEVLGIDTLPGAVPIGIDDNFFGLGGHSLKASIITSRIYKEFAVRVPLVKLFRFPTIRGLSGYIETSAKEEFTEIEPAAEKEYYDLSFNQKRLWIIQQMNRNDNAYNMPAVIEMNRDGDRGDGIDVELIKKTIREIIDRHESLRTGFKEITGKPVQYVVNNYTLPFEMEDISFLEERRRESECKKIMDEFILEPFLLDNPPLFRALLVKLRKDRYILAYNIHHIVSDGWSMGILERDFHEIYRARLNGSRGIGLEPAPLRITYKDFSDWHNRQIEDGYNRRTSREFWIRFLKEELPLLRLPRDFDRTGTYRIGASFRFVLPGNIKGALNRLGQANNITLFALMYTVYNIFLGTLSGQRIIVSSVVSAGRDHPSLQDIVGFFVNSVIFKAEIKAGETFIHFAGHLQERALEFFKHQNYPPELVLDEAGIPYPEVAASFNMINIYSGRENDSLDNLESFHTAGIQNVKFDIELYVQEFGNGIEINVSYNKNRFKAESIEYMMGTYQKIIEFFVENPGKRLEDFKEERKRRSFKRKA
jgi:amino acid adenylation domain-containing protein